MAQWFAGRKAQIAGLVVGGAVLLLLVFCLGVFVGTLGSGRFRQPFIFTRLFGIERGLPGHGAVGTVTAVQDGTITLADRTGQTLSVGVAGDTVIESANLQGRIGLQQIHVGDRIVVLGSPQDGKIAARFIRVLPASPPGQSSY